MESDADFRADLLFTLFCPHSSPLDLYHQMLQRGGSPHEAWARFERELRDCRDSLGGRRPHLDADPRGYWAYRTLQVVDNIEAVALGHVAPTNPLLDPDAARDRPDGGLPAGRHPHPVAVRPQQPPEDPEVARHIIAEEGDVVSEGESGGAWYPPGNAPENEIDNCCKQYG